MSKKKLYKSNNRILCGVCAGIADFFGIDPTIVRLLLVVLVIAGFGTGIIIYLVGAIIMPERRLDDENLRSANINDEKQKNTDYATSDEDREFDSHFKK
jgi:phage shock protein PspC (stress-responsive transcriptional regulator)